MPRVKTNIESFPVDSVERRLLVLTARPEPDDFAKDEIRRLLVRKMDWDALITHSLVHGTAGQLYRSLSSLSEADQVPQTVLERLRAAYLQIAAMGMQNLAHLKVLAEALSESGVQMIALKGAALIEKVYGDPGLRPLSDVDIMVRERDWQVIRGVLRKLGYNPVEKDFAELPPKLTKHDIQAHIQYLSSSGICLEFQFDLFTLGIGMLDVEGVWNRAREVEIGGAKMLALGPEDELLQLTVHANRHGYARLKWLVDIAETLRQEDGLDWDLLISLAKREQLQTSVYSTLVHIEELFGLQLIDKEKKEKLKPRGYQMALWKAVWPRKSREEFEGRYEDGICFYFYRPFCGWNIVNLLLMGRVRDKLAYQARWIAPSLTWMSKTYNTSKSLSLLKYYPVRLVNSSKKKRAE